MTNMFHTNSWFLSIYNNVKTRRCQKITPSRWTMRQYFSILKKLFSTPCWREVNPLGVITHKERHTPHAYQRQRHKPRTCQSMVNTLSDKLTGWLASLVTTRTTSVASPATELRTSMTFSCFLLFWPCLICKIFFFCFVMPPHNFRAKFWTGKLWIFFF